MKTIQEIAQWVIDNRYPKSENNKVSDAEMYHTLIEAMNQVLRQPLVSGSALADLNHNVINAAMNIVGLSDDEKVRKEIDRVIDAVKMFTQHFR